MHLHNVPVNQLVTTNSNTARALIGERTALSQSQIQDRLATQRRERMARFIGSSTRINGPDSIALASTVNPSIIPFIDKTPAQVMATPLSHFTNRSLAVVDPVTGLTTVRGITVTQDGVPTTPTYHPITPKPGTSSPPVVPPASVPGSTPTPTGGVTTPAVPPVTSPGGVTLPSSPYDATPGIPDEALPSDFLTGQDALDQAADDEETAAADAAAAPASAGVPPLLIFAAIGGLAWWYFSKHKKGGRAGHAIAHHKAT